MDFDTSGTFLFSFFLVCFLNKFLAGCVVCREILVKYFLAHLIYLCWLAVDLANQFMTIPFHTTMFLCCWTIRSVKCLPDYPKMPVLWHARKTIKLVGRFGMSINFIFNLIFTSVLIWIFSIREKCVLLLFISPFNNNNHNDNDPVPLVVKGKRKEDL